LLTWPQKNISALLENTPFGLKAVGFFYFNNLVQTYIQEQCLHYGVKYVIGQLSSGTRVLAVTALHKSLIMK